MDYQDVTKIAARAACDELKRFHNQLHSIDEVADRFQVSRKTVYRLMKPDKNGMIHLHSERVGSHLKISGWEIGRFLAYGGTEKRYPLEVAN